VQLTLDIVCRESSKARVLPLLTSFGILPVTACTDLVDLFANVEIGC
jgi:hypothetical protein